MARGRKSHVLELGLIQICFPNLWPPLHSSRLFIFWLSLSYSLQLYHPEWFPLPPSSYSSCILFIFTRWPHLLNSQRKWKSSLDFLTTVSSPNANFLASVCSFSLSFWCQGKVCLFCAKDAPFPMFWIPETPSTSVHSTLFFSSLLNGQSFPLPSLPAQWLSIGNNFAFPPQGIFQCLETFSIVTTRCYSHLIAVLLVPNEWGHGCC